jgi:MFS family permease
MLGTVTAANSGSRYAATDLAEPDHRGRALSVVVWATTIGAVAGPNLTGPAGRLAERLALPALTGPFLVGALAIAAAGVVVLVRLRPDPLLLARGHAAVPRGTAWPQVRRAFREQPLLIAAVAGLAGAHAAMVAVMVMTPLHMEHGGSELEIIGVVISTHVLGMFAFSPLMGLAADRVGPGRVLTGGGGILLVALLLCASSPSGTSWQIFAGLFLLGLGWSAATVAASTLVSVHAPLGVRTDVQGASDLTMNLTAAAGGGLAGVIVGTWGYAVLAAFSGLLAGVVVLAGGAAVVLAARARNAAR